MKRTVRILAALLIPVGAAAAAPARGPLFAGLGRLHHPIATKNEEAQRYFDQGLTFVYAFNHEEAIRSFEEASRLDPGEVMPLWGIAYALGPNINMDVDAKQEKAAFDAGRRALALAGSAPPAERAYVEALSKRYSDDPKANLKTLAADYAAAMKALSARYPDDLDAATLYAESLMDLHPWHLWRPDGTPAPGTEEIVATLESVLRRDPNHIGANHYYIHAVEASPHPERALACARRLAKLVPAAGHLVHMPSHVYMRTGDYAAAVAANVRAAEADRSFFAVSGEQGLYPAMYYNHNLQFGSAAAVMDGNYRAAIGPAEELARNALAMAADMPMVEFVIPAPTLVRLRFHRWNEVLAEPLPPASLRVATAFAHYARAVALASTGHLAGARQERDAFRASRAAVPADFPALGNNGAQALFAVAAPSIDGLIARAAGDRAAAEAALEKAVAAQDALAYDEPPPWYYPVRQTLGAVLLEDGSAGKAEKVFREDLLRNPRNGWSLFGLWKCLEAQHRAADAATAKREFERAWKSADVALRLEDL